MTGTALGVVEWRVLQCCQLFPRPSIGPDRRRCAVTCHHIISLNTLVAQTVIRELTLLRQDLAVRSCATCICDS